MTNEPSPTTNDVRPRWTLGIWGVCLVLLLASTLNYMDRQTLSVQKTEIAQDLGFNNTQYGNLELGFGLAFAVGASTFGFIVDRVNVRWLYPSVMLLWSLAGAATGFAAGYRELLLCRVLLGFFEAAHWPCALRVTERLLSPGDRGFGNSILQSGTSIGAILVPIMIRVMQEVPALNGWRTPFVVTGTAGLGWLLLWQWCVRGVDLSPPLPLPRTSTATGRDPDFARRYVVLIGVVVSINIAWHLFRAWLPAFMEEGRGYSRDAKLAFNVAFNAATDVGCLVAGWWTVVLQRRGRTAADARRIVFTGCAICCASSLAIPWLPNGRGLELVLLLVACGLLGLFPCYYTWTQDLSSSHSGKVAGTLGTIAWLATSPMQTVQGYVIDLLTRHNLTVIQAGQVPLFRPFDVGLALAGCLPLLGAACVWWGWDSRTEGTRA